MIGAVTIKIIAESKSRGNTNNKIRIGINAARNICGKNLEK